MRRSVARGLVAVCLFGLLGFLYMDVAARYLPHPGEGVTERDCPWDTHPTCRKFYKVPSIPRPSHIIERLEENDAADGWRRTSVTYRVRRAQATANDDKPALAKTQFLQSFHLRAFAQKNRQMTGGEIA